MKEFRPQQIANRPIFLIAFTLLGGGYAVWLVYAYLILKDPINWYAIAFVIGVIILQWYSRLSKSYFVRIYDDRVEWKNSSKPKKVVLVSEVKEMIEQSYGLDFLVLNDWEELSLEMFTSQAEKTQIIDALKEWGSANGIGFESKSEL